MLNTIDKSASPSGRANGDLPILELPGHCMAMSEVVSGQETQEFNYELRELLLNLTRKYNRSLYTILLAALNTLLHRYTGQTDIAVGRPPTDSRRMEVTRCNLSGNPSFKDLLAGLEGSTITELEEKVQVWLDLSEIYPPAGRGETFDLRFTCIENTNRLTVYLDYNTKRFGSDTIVRMLENFKTLLDGIIADPEQRLSELPLLAEAELQRLLIEWNDTRADYPENKPIHRLFEMQVERTPDAVAVTYGERQLSYAELNRKANQLAHVLRERGAGPGDVVGICIKRSFDTVVSMLAVFKAGGAYLALDPQYPDARLTFMLNEAGVKLLLTCQQWAARLSGFPTELVLLDQVDASSPGQTDGNPPADDDPDSLAYVVFTSGSTGLPKGVLNSHSGVANYLTFLRRTYGLHEKDVVLQLASLSFDASIRDILGPLTTGAQIVMVSDSEARDPAALVRKIREYEITCLLSVVPTVLNALLEAVGDEEPVRGMLRILIVSGEALSRTLCNKTKHIFGKDVLVVNQYGPTECTMTSTYFPVDGKHDALDVVSIGRPIQNCQIYLLDRYLNPAPIGATGEIYIGGAGVTRGYLNQPDLNRERFIQNPFSTRLAPRLYRTGDLARYLSDGNLQFLGRTDDQVKIGGVRVELKEIESQLAKHPGVKACAVIVREDGSKKNILIAKEGIGGVSDSDGSTKRLFAYVIPRSEVSGVELGNFLQELLPPHMIPVQFIKLDSLPMTANGKLKTDALPDPQTRRPELEQVFVAPNTEPEIMIAGIWEEILQIEPVGVNDDFFELGGDSLLGMQMLNRVRHMSKKAIGFDQLFKSPTVAGLAQKLSAHEGSLPATATATATATETEATRSDFLAGEPVDSRTELEIPQLPPSSNGIYPVSLAQEGVWFLWRMEPNTPYYTSQAVIRLQGELKIQEFRRAWQALLKRHEALCARFGEREGKPFQTFGRFEDQTWELPVMDLSDLPAEERKQVIDHMAQNEAARPFDLEAGPLLRCQLFKLSENEHALLRTMHEIAVDLWSVRVMMRELGSLYNGICEGDDDPLGALKVRFSDYVRWERKYYDRERLSDQENYWRGQIGGQLPVLELPIDRPRPKEPTYRGGSKHILLDKDLSRKLHTLGREQETTLFVTLLSAFNVLLHRYTGQDDIIIGAPLANRSHRDLEGLVGFFLNMLPLRTDVSDNPSFQDLVSRVRKTVNSALSNADYPFMWMMEWTHAIRDTSISPVFQVMFNMLSYTDAPIRPDALEMTHRGLDTGYTKYDLSLYAQQYGERISLQLCYLSDLFEEDTIERMMKNFVVLLHSIVADPKCPISRVQLLDETEMHKLLAGFNDTSKGYGNSGCLHQLFEEQTAKTPDAVALICKGEQLHYAELNTRANQLAHHLRDLGVGAETSVAVYTERSFSMLVAMLGVIKAGGAYVALEPTFPLLRLQEVLEDVQPPFIVLESGLDRFDNYPGTKIFLGGNGGGFESRSDSNLPSITTPENLLNIVYSSSSTGKPKGALITMSAVLNRLFWMWDEYPFRSGDVAIIQKSYALVAATWECFGGLLKGIPTVIASQEDLMDPVELWKTLVESKVTYLLATPPLLQGVLDQAEVHQDSGCSLRLATTSAEPVPLAMISRWRRLFPEVPLLNLYGSTECSSNVTCCDTRQLDSGGLRIPIGKPIANTRVFILNDQLELSPIGVTGEMCVAGACVARSYVNQPELTAEKFIPDRFSEEANSPLYRTGDLVRYRRDGTLELIGRRDNQVKLRGFRIELQDIEDALLRHKLVSNCAVSLHEDKARGKHLVAYLVAAPELSLPALRRFLSEQLPVYMVPAEYVWLDRLPLTPNGKLDRQALPDPTQTRPELNEAYVAPRTPLERELAATWKEVLGIDRVGVDDNFFELGGHSLQAAQLASRLSEKFARGVSVMEIFSYPSIADFVEMLLAETIQDSPAKSKAGLTAHAKPVDGVVSAMPDDGKSSQDSSR